ncbi:MAG: transporter permease [Caulobacter sp.]|nr:transporter permease [Caulobacter sp.]
MLKVLRSLRSIALSWSGIATLLLAWWLNTRLGLFPPQVLAPPERVAAAFVAGVRSGDLARNLVASLSVLAAGYVIGATLGVAFGVAMARSRTIESYTSGLFHAIRQVPTIAFIPMLVLMFGIEATFKIVVVGKASFYPAALAAYTAVQGLPRRYFDVADVYRLSPLARLRHVILPASLPPVLTGLRLSLSRAWVALVAAELLVADRGIGQMMELGRQTFRLDVVLMGVVLIGAIGFLLDRGFKRVERLLVRGAPA